MERGRIRALLFDFDGTLVETEGPSLAAWREVYERHGVELTLDAWAACLGTIDGFDPIAHLEELTGRRVDDPEGVNEAVSVRFLELVADEPLRPGLDAYLERAGALGLRVAIVSSSHVDWITSNLARIGRADGWACTACANGDPARAKPLPLLYEEALAELGLAPGEAIAFEDTPNGIAAAKAAGLFCVAVSNPLTRTLDLSRADLLVSSFEDVSLDDVLATAARS